MSKTFFISLIISILFPIQMIHAQSEDFEVSAIEIIMAFDSKDSDVINQYIYPDFGLFVLFRMGVLDDYRKTNKFDFDKPIPGYLPYFPFKIDLNIKFQELPEFDCGSENWSKIGLFCDTIRKDNLLSQTAINLNEYREENIPIETIEEFKAIEKQSHRVVLVDDEGGELIFHITLIKNKWYLTIIDRVSSDCSA